MNIEKAIQTAIEYEIKVRDVYKDAEIKATSPVGKRVFNVLVLEEQKHLDYLENRLQEWQSTGKVRVEKLDTAIPSKDAINSEVTKLQTKLQPGDSDKKYSDVELQMLKKALEVEIETSEFYKKLVAELPKPDQELFKRFVEIEEGHKAIVQAEIDSVTGLGYWFDMPEFRFESG